jgi:hypothetical protein
MLPRLPSPYPYPYHLAQANEPRGAEGVLETKQAYEFTLDTIGQDIHSGRQDIRMRMQPQAVYWRFPCTPAGTCWNVIQGSIFVP